MILANCLISKLTCSERSMINQVDQTEEMNKHLMKMPTVLVPV